MKRTLIVVVIALTVLMAGCGGPGEAPEEDPAEDGDVPEDDPADDPADPADEDEGDDLAVDADPAASAPG